jgi:hypothetical protein
METLKAYKQLYTFVGIMFAVCLTLFLAVLSFGALCLSPNGDFIPLDNITKIIVGIVLIPLSVMGMFKFTFYGLVHLWKIQDLVKQEEARLNCMRIPS